MAPATCIPPPKPSSAPRTGSGHTIVVTSDPEAVAGAERIVLPGVGAFADCRRGLDARARHGRGAERGGRRGRQAVSRHLRRLPADGRARPGEGDDRGLGWIAGDVAEIAPADPELKIPHMGWNTLTVARDHPLLAGIPTGERGLDAYFVHSFHIVRAARTSRGVRGLWRPGHRDRRPRQSSPARSSIRKRARSSGWRLIANFLKWRPDRLHLPL